VTAAVAPAPAAAGFLATARGRVVLVILASVGFLDFVDASIVNIALPDVGTDLGISVRGLQWVVSGYLLTYGGFMLLGGRLADLLGRRTVLLTGTVVFAVASLTAGVAQSAEMLVGSRLAQGLGAALMVPAALSLLTTSFVGPERHRVLAVWGGIAGLGGGIGVLVGGLFTEGPGWRWIFFVNPPISIALVIGIALIFPADRRRARLAEMDLPGAALITGGMLLLVYALVRAPEQGWASTRTVIELVGAALVLAAFVAVETMTRRPLVPLAIFRIRGLAAAQVTQLVGVGGFVTTFFFLTLYMQRVLGYSPVQAGLAYLPATVGIGISVALAAQAISRFGTRPVIIAGALVTAAGLWLLSGIDVGGSYASDVLPGLAVTAVGIGGVFVGTTTAANAGVPPSLAGLAAALVNASQQVGGALGLAIFTALATTRTNDLLGAGADIPAALTEGFQRAFVAAALFLLGAAVVAIGTATTRGDETPAA
jgi:EmrB/QacA subfamily drug resistance transporter